MKTIALFLALGVSAFAQTYALKTPDNNGLFLDPKTLAPVFVEVGKDVPVGKEAQYWIVEKTVAEGFRQIGWKLSGGKCVADVVAIPAPTQEQLDAKAALTARIEQAEADKLAADQLKKFLVAFEEKSASPELQAEALRLILRDYLRRLGE